MKTTMALAVSILMLGAFASPTFADKGGVPNENASEKAGGSSNAHGGNPNANENASKDDGGEPE